MKKIAILVFLIFSSVFCRSEFLPAGLGGESTWLNCNKNFVFCSDGAGYNLQLYYMRPNGSALYNLATQPIASLIAIDDLCYSDYDNTLWGCSGAGLIYHTTLAGAEIAADRITVTIANFEMEGVCLDGERNFWCVQDSAVAATLIKINVGTTGTVAVANATVSLATKITGPQSICWDSIRNTFWITENSGINRNHVYQMSKDGDVISSFSMDAQMILDDPGNPGYSATDGGILQGVEHSATDDTLWITARTGYVYHVTTGGVIISKTRTPTQTDGPTSLALIPAIPTFVKNPFIYMPLNDNLATKNVIENSYIYTGTSIRNTSVMNGGTGYLNFAAASTDYITFAASFDLNALFPLGWTISIWLNPTGVVDVTLLGNSTGTNYVGFVSGTSIRFRVNNVQKTISGLTSAFVTGEWQHLMITRNVNQMRIYRNNVQIGAISDSGYTAAWPLERLGARNGYYYSGGAKELVILPYEANTAQRLLLYNNGKINANTVR